VSLPLARLQLLEERSRTTGRSRTNEWTNGGKAAAQRVHRLEPPTSVAKRLSDLETFCGDKTAFIGARDGSAATWSDAANRVGAWRSAFAHNSVVGLRLSDPVAFSYEYLAALGAGVCIAPLDPRCTADELRQLSDLLELTDIVTDERGEPEASDLPGGLLLSSSDGLRRSKQSRSFDSPVPDASVLLTTSGTSGRPKIVPLDELHLLRVATHVALHHSLSPRERGYSPLPLCHVNAQVVGVLSTLVSGASLVVDDRFHRSDFWSVVEEFDATWLNLVPAILGALSNEKVPGSATLGSIRFARSASAPLAASVQERFEAETGISVIETYGMTEAASQIAANAHDPGARRVQSVGKPLGVMVRFVDEEGREVPDGIDGHVEISGPNVIDNYLGRHRKKIPARNSEGWLHTGDLGCRDEVGYVYLNGRADDVINRGGEKIHPGEIENILLRDKRVASAAVVGRPHPILGSEVIACIEAPELDEAATTALTQSLLSDCTRSLSRHKQPARIFVLEHMPRGVTGKLIRSRLQELVVDRETTAEQASQTRSA